MDELTERIKKVIKENLLTNSDAEINLNDEFVNDLGFDSVQFMGLFYTLEEEFNISIINSNENYMFFSITTVSDLADVLKTVIAKN